VVNIAAVLRPMSEAVGYPRTRETETEAKAGFRKWRAFDNIRLPHFALSGIPAALAYCLRHEAIKPGQKAEKIA